jgi:regulator of PEP synthase PpsR (kinase-PPPase family)
MANARTVFFVSDRTGITAEILGRTLLSQFPGIELRQRRLPFVDTPVKARAARAEIEAASRRDGLPAIVFSTLIDEEIRAIISTADALHLDLFEGFIRRLEAELGMVSSHTLGLAHGVADELAYQRRMEAVNFTLAHDDGAATPDYANADVILVGVSRSGKTPTCLYLALQYGVFAANYPLTAEDLERQRLPGVLAPYRAKLYGLTISPERLARIRQERRPASRYAAFETCRREVQAAEALFREAHIPFLDTTAMSVEEIAVNVMHATGLIERPRP